MDPYQAARLLYSREPCARSFEEDLLAHFHTGTVVSTPTVFGLIRPVLRAGEPEEIVNPWMYFHRADCWHVYLAAGNLADLEPFLRGFEWVSFERKNVLHFRRYRILRAKILARWTPSAPTSTPPLSARTGD